jgi:hypothetical protein
VRQTITLGWEAEGSSFGGFVQTIDADREIVSPCDLDGEEMVRDELDASESRNYEQRVLEAVRLGVSRPQQNVLAQLEAIELAGSRPDSLIVISYRNRSSSVERYPRLLASGTLREVAPIWEWADATEDGVPDYLHSPLYVAYLVWNAFEAAELTLVDDDLRPLRRAPAASPRLYLLPPRR